VHLFIVANQNFWNVEPVDWVILIVFFILLTLGGAACRRYVKGVADFLVGGRKVRKFLGLSAFGAEGLGLISVVSICQEGFARGFSIIWFWMISITITAVIFGGFGFIISRFRDTNAMTLAQYFEDRYSKSVRIVAGIVTSVSGLLNMAVFPIVGGLFLIHFMGFPEEITLFGITMRSVVPLMTVMIGIALLFTFMGGMVSLILTDFIQSVVITIAIVVGAVFLMQDQGVGIVDSTLRSELGESGYNPFATKSYGALFFAWMIIGNIVGIVFLPTMQRVASTDSSKTARQMVLIGSLFTQGRGFLLLAFGIVALGVMGNVPPEGTTEETWQRAAPAIFLGQSFPPIVKGLFLSGLIAAFVSTVDSYFLAWGANITNDVICPFLSKPLSPRSHVKLIRVVIVLIAVFLWLFGVMYVPKDSIMEYLMLTGSMFHGTGIVVIGGLYWKRGTAPAALVSIVTVCAVPFLDLLLRRVWEGYAESFEPAQVGIVNVCLGMVLFVTISLLTYKESPENV
jgi:SSS family solute:Na+ symporter